MKRKNSLRPGQRVRAFISVEHRRIYGVVLEILQRNVWVQIADFPAPILVPLQCVEPI
jgi:hypothetical protein